MLINFLPERRFHRERDAFLVRFPVITISVQAESVILPFPNFLAFDWNLES
jgi:hypothetical protein